MPGAGKKSDPLCLGHWGGGLFCLGHQKCRPTLPGASQMLTYFARGTFLWHVPLCLGPQNAHFAWGRALFLTYFARGTFPTVVPEFDCRCDGEIVGDQGEILGDFVTFFENLFGSVLHAEFCMRRRGGNLHRAGLHVPCAPVLPRADPLLSMHRQRTPLLRPQCARSRGGGRRLATTDEETRLV